MKKISLYQAVNADMSENQEPLLGTNALIAAFERTALGDNSNNFMCFVDNKNALLFKTFGERFLIDGDIVHSLLEDIVEGTC